MDLPQMREMVRSGPVVLAAVGCLLALNSGTACGQWEQIHKLTAEDAAENDQFGNSVSVNGNIIVIGAWYDDDACPIEPWCDSGAAYVFDATTGEQLHKLTADDGAEWDLFGESVSVSGNIIVVGAYHDDEACPDYMGCNSGSAYVFDATTGEQIHKLTADDSAPGQRFGGSVSIDQSTIVVGADGDSHAGGSSGSAYVFDAVTGEQLHKLIADDAAEGARFGKGVSVSGDTIVVGAYHDHDAGPYSGSVYVFDGITGDQLRKLTADDAEGYESFGEAVSINANIIVVGAPDNTSLSYKGSAYVFDAATGEQLHKLIADDGMSSRQLGRCVCICGNTIVLGAPAHATPQLGAAYVFDATTGKKLRKLKSAEAENDNFGFGVSISGNTIVVGDSRDDDGCLSVSQCDSGSAYVFQMFDAPCPADIDGDQTVDVLDLLAILAAWGPCEPDCPEDIDGDGVVDVLDLLEVLSAWGPCDSPGGAQECSHG